MSARALGFAVWAALIALHGAWVFWIAPPANGAIGLALALTIAPLLLPLLALRRGPRRALLWVGMLCLFYFCHGVVAAWGEPRARLPALIEIALTLVMIGTLGWEARHYKRRRA